MDSSLLVKALALQHIPFEQRLILTVYLLIIALVLLPLTGHYWKRLYRKYLRRFPEAQHVFEGHTSFTHAVRDVGFVLKVVVIAYAAFIALQLYNEAPVIEHVLPQPHSKLESSLPSFVVTFSVPVDKDAITFNLSPTIDGEWMWDAPTVGGFYRTARFLPAESFFPDSKVVLYMVGVTAALGNDTTHEMALEWTGPRTPNLIHVFPQDGQQEVAPDTVLRFEYTELLGDFVDTQVVIEPSVGDFVITNHGFEQAVSFAQPLEQDQEYAVHIFQTGRSYDAQTKEDRIRGETRLLTAFSFRTVATPLIAQYSPRGTAALPHDPLRIEFDQEMDRVSVEEHLSIDPQIAGTTTWESDAVMVFAPIDGWQRATAYTVRLGAGTKSLKGGTLPDGVELPFGTIGAVKVADISPLNGATGIDPNSANVRIVFDQPVDQESAASAVSISPRVEYATSWQDNTLILATAGKLGHMTKYTIAVAAGIKSIHGLDSTEAFNSTFTTKQKTFVLGIPYYGQEETFTCNISAMRMALAYRGVYLAERTIKDGVGYSGDPNQGWVDGYGVHSGPVSAYMSNHRSVAVKQGWNITDMLKEVHKGNPVIIWEYNRYSQPYGAFALPSGATGYMGMHSEVIRGYIGDIENPTHILTNDPWRGQLTYTIDTFKSIWGYMNNTALVVY